MTSRNAAPLSESDILELLENVIGVSSSHTRLRMEQIVMLAVKGRRSEIAQPVAWIATYTDSAGQHHEPLHFSARDSDKGGWKVEVVLEQPNDPDMAALAAAHKAVLNITGIEERSTSARCVGVPITTLTLLRQRCGYIIHGYGEAKLEAVEMERIVNELLAAAPVSPAPKHSDQSSAESELARRDKRNRDQEWDDGIPQRVE